MCGDHKPRTKIVARRPKLYLAVVLMTGMHSWPVAAETLNHMLGQAYLFSPALKSARDTLDAVNEQRPMALSSWLPTLSVTGSAATVQNSEPSTPNFSDLASTHRYTQLGVTSELSWPITQGGGEFAKLRAADHMIAAARANLLSAEQNILFTAATAYLDVLTQRAILQAQVENLEALREILAVVKQQVAAGDRTLPEQTRVDLDISEAMAALIDTRSQVDQALARYEMATGVPPQGELESPAPISILPPTLEDALTLALSANPNVLSSAAMALAARDAVDQAGATLLPSLAFVVSDEHYRRNYPDSFNGLSGPFRGSSIRLQLTIPLYQGGAEYAAVRQAKKIAYARYYDGQQAKIDVRSQAQQAWLQRQNYISQNEFYQNAVKLSEQLVDQYRRVVAGGEITIFEALDGYSSRLTAKIQMLTVVRNRTLADYALLFASGGLTARSLELDVPYYDPLGDYSRTKWRIWGLGIE